MGRLANKRCLVTGAARGIGAAIARTFTAEGAEVIVTDIDAESGRTVARECGGRFEVLDVASEADWARIANVLPTMDVVVNNAGITGLEPSETGALQPHDPEHASLDDWQAVHTVNLNGTFLGCRYAIRAMRDAGAGSIINVSSRSGMTGVPMAAAYASSKAAIRNHTKSVALYCAGRGWKIRCNSIHPGAILTPMWDPLLGEGPEREARLKSFVADTPLRRFGRAEEVAALAVFLASDESAYVTGSELAIDGGLLAGTAMPPEG